MPRPIQLSISSAMCSGERQRKPDSTGEKGRSQKVHRKGHPRLVNIVVMISSRPSNEVYMPTSSRCRAGKPRESRSSVLAAIPLLTVRPAPSR
jgi:hypothetical protein